MIVEKRRDEPSDQFPVGMRVLAVDDDPICLKLLETLLRKCQYHGLIPFSFISSCFLCCICSPPRFLYLQMFLWSLVCGPQYAYMMQNSFFLSILWWCLKMGTCLMMLCFHFVIWVIVLLESLQFPTVWCFCIIGEQILSLCFLQCYLAKICFCLQYFQHTVVCWFSPFISTEYYQEFYGSCVVLICVISEHCSYNN